MRATVDYRKDAKPGDKLWRYHAEMTRRDAKGEYKGRGLWELDTVTKVARKYVTVGESDFEIETGRARMVNGFAPQNIACGEVELDRWRYDQCAHEIARIVQVSDKIAEVAALIGYKLPPLWVRPDTDWKP